MIKKILRKIYHFTLGRIVIKSRGKRTVEKYCNDIDKFYIVTSHGLGDIAWMSVYLKSYFDFNNIDIKDVVIVTQEKLSGIIRTFGIDYNYAYVSKDELINMQLYLSTCEYRYKNIKLAIFPLSRLDKKLGTEEFELLSKAGADMDRLYRIGCFSLPTGTEAVPQVCNLAKDERKIILVPYVNSRNIIPMAIWQDIASICKKYCSSVYTNTAPNEDPISGTLPFVADLNKIADSISDQDLVIGGRCGLMDWLFVSQKNILVTHSILSRDDNRWMVARNNFAEWESFEELRKEIAVFNNKYVKDIRLLISEDKTNLSVLEQEVRKFYEDQ